MIYGYARISTDGQSLDAQRAELAAAGCAKVFAETASGARADRPGSGAPSRPSIPATCSW